MERENLVTISYGLDKSALRLVTNLMSARACLKKKRRSSHSNVYRWLKGAVADFKLKTLLHRNVARLLLFFALTPRGKPFSYSSACVFSMLQGKIAVYKHVHIHGYNRVLLEKRTQKKERKTPQTLRPNTQVCRWWETEKVQHFLFPSTSAYVYVWEKRGKREPIMTTNIQAAAYGLLAFFALHNTSKPIVLYAHSWIKYKKKPSHSNKSMYVELRKQMEMIYYAIVYKRSKHI